MCENAVDRSAHPLTGRLTRAGDPGPNSSILLGLSARPVCSFLALDPDADVLGSSLMTQEDSDCHWHVSIDLSGSIAITKDHNQVAKLSSPLCTRDFLQWLSERADPTAKKTEEPIR